MDKEKVNKNSGGISSDKKEKNRDFTEENEFDNKNESVNREKNIDSEFEQGERTAESELELELSREELIEEVRQKTEKINELDAEIDDLLSRLQRLQADFVNYRKRSRREKAEMALKGKINLTSEIVPVIDNFERALSSADKSTDFYSGVEMIYKQLLKTLSDQGIEEIAAEGEEFNPEFHEAIMKVDAESEEEEGFVVEVMQKGFILEGRVIRPAMVKVAV